MTELKSLGPIALDEIRAARTRIAGLALRTPLVPLNVEDAGAEIHLKLENLQPYGSFKVRGAANALMTAEPGALEAGVYTASAGNWAQGLGFVARRLDVPCCAVVPDHAPQTKLDALERLGTEVIRLPFDEWWQVIVEHHYAGARGCFIHPVSDAAVIAGHGTIGLEILEDIPDPDAIVVPFGGGGLSSGIASAVRALKPDTRVYAAEVATSAPLAASLAAGEPRAVEHVPSFVDGIGGKSLLAEMWGLVSTLIDASLVVTVEQIAGAIHVLAERNRVVAEGAGAAGVAAALAGKAGRGRIVCIVSGGNIDADTLCAILQGRPPAPGGLPKRAGI